MEHSGTKNSRTRVAANIESELIAKIDDERRGRCSRAAILRMALLDRYKKEKRTTKQVA